jgi:hypothetical protein
VHSEGSWWISTETRVAWAELLPVVALALMMGSAWRGKLVMSFVDNQGACAAINKRTLKDPAMRYLQCLLVRCEMKYGFEMHGPYINTHYNTLADDISRLVGKVSESKLQDHIDTLHEGLVRGSIEEEVEFLVQQCERTEKSGWIMPLSLLGEKRLEVEREEAEARLERRREVSFEGLSQVGGVEMRLVELNAGLGQFSMVAESLGWAVTRMEEEDVQVREVGEHRLREAHKQGSQTRGASQTEWTVMVVNSYIRSGKSLTKLLEGVNTVSWEMAEGLLERCKERAQRFGTNEDATEGAEEEEDEGYQKEEGVRSEASKSGEESMRRRASGGPRREGRERSSGANRITGDSSAGERYFRGIYSDL